MRRYLEHKNMTNEINIEWIVAEFEKLKESKNIIMDASKLKENLLTIAKQKIIGKEISFAEFFAIALGLVFLNDLITRDRFAAPTDPFQIYRRELILRQVTVIDVDDAIKYIKKYWK